VVKERDLIGTLLIRRNDELSLLYEKIKIFELTLHKAELQYKQRLEDIRILKIEIQNQRCKNKVLAKGSEAADDLRFVKRSTVSLFYLTLSAVSKSKRGNLSHVVEVETSCHLAMYILP